MIIILSPSKTQKIVPVEGGDRCSQPLLLQQSALLIKTLKKLDHAQLSSLMKTSKNLTDLTRRRINEFKIPHEKSSAGIALKTFQGDAFSAIDTDFYDTKDFEYADKHVRILSGLYGVLRPLDLIQEHRLEMGAKLITDRGTTLYQFWGSMITDVLNDDLERMDEQVVINCASQEYSRAVQPKQLSGEMITISFKQRRNNVVKSIAIHSKRARGMFTDFLVKNKATTPDTLASFNSSGYRYESRLSSSQELVFITDLD